ncbi:MAG TPA: HAMP domain-containing sensor histidine kinase [Ktedonobacteraceae bacterium]|jgi:heavy metal sensor kinase|nr:HAMP domain-containing sensor histidine kinase [Ktedonobacteraceae bacterium]
MISRLRAFFPPGIRMQLALCYTLAFAVLLVSTGAVFYNYLETSLEAGVDDALQLRAQQLAADIEISKDAVMIHCVGADCPDFEGREKFTPLLPVDVNYGMLVRLLDAHGKTLGETNGFRSLRVPEESVSQPLQYQPWQGTILDHSGEEVRLYSRLIMNQGQPIAVIQVGQSLAQLHSLLHNLVGALLITGSLVLLLCAFGSYWLAARSFAPFQRLSETTRRIKAGDLHQRVHVPASRDEVQYLAETLNDMLQALDLAFTRQRRFVADASHELRTPVSVIRNKADIALLGTPTLQGTIAVLHEIRTETDRLSHLLSDLLALARGDEGQARFEHEVVRLDQVVEAVASTAETLAAEQDIHLEVQTCEQVTLIGDEARLIQVVLNLVDNALRYTNPGGNVWVQVTQTSTVAQLRVEDNGIGIAPEHLSHIFERFYRADSSRRLTGGSSTGLGLAIVDWVVRMHGGSISVESQLEKGSCFTVTLPLSRPVAPEAESHQHKQPSSTSTV